ncbi:MAG: FAD-dependent oxidoreductase [Nitrospira sp. CG24B]|nr:MAG: FAD-dependent oxidoreductase [Nitrospira sp. CG24B]
MKRSTPHVLIIGAGLAGLVCARRLTQSGLTCTILEASDGIGGRIRTDRVEGFQLDRGFQTLLTGYPEARTTLNYTALNLMPFHPGALIRYAGRFHLMSDLFRRPQDLIQTLVSPIGSLSDKLRLLRVRRDALRQRLCSEMSDPACPIHEVLQTYQFSDAMVTRFFHPFLSGVFLETGLTTPCWIFELVWGAFCRGTTALPRDGMGAIAQQLAAPLPSGAIRLNQAVQHIQGSSVKLESGEQLTGDVLVVATDHATAARLRGEHVASSSARGSMTLYFDAPAAPQPGPWLILNGEDNGLVRTVCVLSEAAPSYAPPGRALISVTATEQIGAHDDLVQAVRLFLQSWFGSQVNGWRHLRTDHIYHALPPIDLLSPGNRTASPRVAAGLYLCGDYRESGTLDGALLSGRKAAEAVLSDYDLS